MDDEAHLLDKYKQALQGISVSHAWRGHGSAIFLEFGKLTPKLREDGTTGNPDGELSLMIEWSWRIEEADYIACGSSSEEKVWRPWLAKLIGKVVLDVTLFGRLPELMLTLTDDLYLSSFMTAEGHPEWALIDHRNGGLPALVSLHGRIGSEDELSP
ncbi:hypothetical protein [Croceibacterium ferulae]|uniref:hypothetical protein n=1 Tax=Croceibacterium ferulae TaxID=1854641 RepID=UPI000F8613B0|nr:hypothetical protein [Croceibacterium ferulae]